ncbi:hypothetical protein LTR95_016407 [Oleoguttula sp. CCFEE 5521]
MDDTAISMTPAPVQSTVMGDVLSTIANAATVTTIWAVVLILVLVITAGLVLYCCLIGYAINSRVKRTAHQDDVAVDTDDSCSAKKAAIAGFGGIVAVLNLMVVAINVSEAPSGTWSQHAWTTSQQMLWVHLGEFVAISTLGICAGVLALLGAAIQWTIQTYSAWKQKRATYRQAHDCEEQLQDLEEGLEGK